MAMDNFVTFEDLESNCTVRHRDVLTYKWAIGVMLVLLAGLLTASAQFAAVSSLAKANKEKNIEQDARMLRMEQAISAIGQMSHDVRYMREKMDTFTKDN